MIQNYSFWEEDRVNQFGSDKGKAVYDAAQRFEALLSRADYRGSRDKIPSDHESLSHNGYHQTLQQYGLSKGEAFRLFVKPNQGQRTSRRQSGKNGKTTLCLFDVHRLFVKIGH